MNEFDFGRFRREPSAQFTASLYRRITDRPTLRSRMHSTLANPVSRLRFGVILIASLAIIGACARAAFSPRIVPVGRFWVSEMSERFLCGEDVVDLNYTPSGFMPTPQPAPTPEPLINLQEFRESLDFTLRVPTWAPDGYVLQDSYPRPGRFVWYSINWIGPKGTYISMFAWPWSDWPTGMEIRRLPGSWEEVAVDGEPGVIVHGECVTQTVFLPVGSAEPEVEVTWVEEMTRLYWSQDGAYYELSAYPIEVDVLVRMAESAQ